MINICSKHRKIYCDHKDHNYWSCGPYTPSNEAEIRNRVVNNLKKLRGLSESCSHMVPVVCGLVAEIQADINALWGE